MKDNWKELTIGDEINLLGGFPFSSSNFNEEGVGTPLIRIRDLLNSSQETFYSGSFSNSYLIKEQDILVGMDGDFHIVKWKNSPSLLNQRILKVSGKKESEIDIDYLFYYLHPFLLDVHAKTAATTVKHLSTFDISTAIDLFPPLPQQRKIANILSTCDQVIEKTEAAIAKYQALKQGMMHDLFTRGIDLNTGKLRPKYQDAPELYKESDLGMIPKDWEMGHFIDFADERISHSFTGGPFGSDLQTRDYTKEGVRIIQLQNIGDGKFNNGYKIYTSEEKANYLRACNIYPGEIILSKMAEPIARACIIPIDNERYLMASDGIRLSIDKKRFNLRFVLETINQKRFRSIAEIRSTGTTRSRIGLTELKGIPVCYPQKNEQDIIGIKLDNLEESIEIEQSALSKYQQLKAGLMQDLLTGKVEVAEEIVKN